MTVSDSFPSINADADPPLPPELTVVPILRPDDGASERLQAEAPDSWRALLGNRFIIGALGAVVVLLLTAIVLVAIGHGDDVSSGSNGIVVPVTDDGERTPGRVVGGLAGTTVNTVSYRNGPGIEYVVLGTIPHGVAVSVIGRNENNTWLQVRYPPNSTLKGWIDAKLLNVNGDFTGLAIAGPGPVASAGVTSVPTVAVYEPAGTPTDVPVIVDEPTNTPRPTRTATRPTVTPYRTPFPTATPGVVPTEAVPTESVTG